MNNFLKNLGIILIVVGAVMLIASFYVSGLSSQNGYTATALVICIIGLVAHIVLNKRITD